MQRKLTTILAADVVGYSALMETDDADTLGRLKQNRSEIFDPCVAAHGGRLIKLMGDGALVEFGSIVAAVNCALEIQEKTELAEPGRAGAGRIQYRIGINLGDVIVDGDDLYGDGVNVAARLEALSPVGGIAISRPVHDQIEGKVACVFEDLGDVPVKNIRRPVRVFSLKPAGRSSSGDGAATETARHAAICVLPFANMSGDAEQEYFSDGITEDIITDLSKVSALWVAARNTAFTFKGRHVDVPQIARQLKVSHVLEGSVRKSGNRVRITAQLIDGATGGHVWAERYDRDLDDIFALQDEISKAIVDALKIKLLPEERKAIANRGTTNPEAYELYLMARQYHVTHNVTDVQHADVMIRLCQRAVDLDPNYAFAWALMSVAQRLKVYAGHGGDSGLTAADRALQLDDTLAAAHATRASVFRARGDYEEARREFEVGLHLDPESHEVNTEAAKWNFARGLYAEAIRHWEKTATLAELDFAATGMLMTCYSELGDAEGKRSAAERTLTRCEKILAQQPGNGSAMAMTAGAFAALGQTKRAQDWSDRAVAIEPENANMRYNLACTLICDLQEIEAGLDMLAPALEKFSAQRLEHAKTDPDLSPVRDHPRFKALIAAAARRLGGEGFEPPANSV